MIVDNGGVGGAKSTYSHPVTSPPRLSDWAKHAANQDRPRPFQALKLHEWMKLTVKEGKASPWLPGES